MSKSVVGNYKCLLVKNYSTGRSVNLNGEWGGSKGDEKRGRKEQQSQASGYVYLELLFEALLKNSIEELT